MAILGVLTCLVLAGCVRETGGVGAAPVPASAAAEATEVPLPPRPRDVDVRGVDPCSLLTGAQRAELGLDAEPMYDVQVSPLFEGPEPACTVGGFEPRAVVARVALPYDGLGVDAFAASRVRAMVTETEIGGFPAILARPSDDLRLCSVVVDVAPRQAVNVHLRDGGGQPAITMDELCAGASGVAEAATATLLALS